MYNVYATITIDSKLEQEFDELLYKLQITYTDVTRCVNHGRYMTKYTLDISNDCLKTIESAIKTISITLTPYKVSNLGLKVIDTDFGTLI